MTESPTGFTYREREWHKINASSAPRKVVMAALREAKLENYSPSSHMGGTAEEVRRALERAQMKLFQDQKKKHKSAVLITANEANDFLRSLPEKELT